MDSNPQLDLLRELQQRYGELRAEMAAILERSRAIRAEIAEQHAERLRVEQQIRAANRAPLDTAVELMATTRQIGSVTKAIDYFADR